MRQTRPRMLGVLPFLMLAFGCAARRPDSTVLALDVRGEYTGSGLTADSVLQAFNFRFLNGDHPIGRVRLLAGHDGSVGALFADADLGKDTWGVYAHYSAVARLPTLWKMVECTSGAGFCDIDLGVDVTDKRRFALVGFEFERLGGGDQRIKAIGIMPGHPQPHLLRVTFRDDSPGDDQFRCRVQYKLVPYNGASSLPASHLVSGGNSRRIGDMLGGEPDDRVLSGFQFNYTGHDARLLRLGTDITIGTVSFEDNDPEEPISWDVAYLQLANWKRDGSADVSDEEAELGPRGEISDPSEVDRCVEAAPIMFQCTWTNDDGTQGGWAKPKPLARTRVIGREGSFGEVVVRTYCKSEDRFVNAVGVPPCLLEGPVDPANFCYFGIHWPNSYKRRGLSCVRVDG